MSFLAAALPGLIATGIGGLSGLMGRQNTETDMQKKQRQLVDQLLAGISGEGQYADLFNVNQEAYQKSYVDPMLAQFRNQVAPQIQQQYIASGQQRGTGLQDTLTRAGVDLDQLLNQQYASMLQQSQQNKLGGINAILGAGAGAPKTPSPWQAFGQGITGSLKSPAFGEYVSGFTRKGF